MPTRIYTGPHAGAEVVLPDGSTKQVARGESEDFPADVAASLDEQGDCWSTPKAKKATKTNDTASGGKE
jgi:hypothetical protein